MSNVANRQSLFEDLCISPPWWECPMSPVTRPHLDSPGVLLSVITSSATQPELELGKPFNPTSLKSNVEVRKLKDSVGT